MAFGQQSGPPAPASKVRELLILLQEAGHADFREARGEMGFTQRQAGGRFTRDEVAAFIDRLQDAGPDPQPAGPRRAAAPPEAPAPANRTPSNKTPSDHTPSDQTPPAQSSALGRVLRGLPAEQLAAELRRRGWLVLEP